LLISIIHIIKESSKDLLKKWWASKPQKVHLAFLTLLEISFARFEGLTSILFALSNNTKTHCYKLDQTLSSMIHFIALDVINLFMKESASSEGDQEINPLVEKYFILIRMV